MGECYLFVGLEVKIVEFESSMEIVKVPEIGASWNERRAPLQKFLLG